jgi:hypothetical protein
MHAVMHVPPIAPRHPINATIIAGSIFYTSFLLALIFVALMSLLLFKYNTFSAETKARSATFL